MKLRAIEKQRNKEVTICDVPIIDFPDVTMKTNKCLMRRRKH
jgi:hypothetical protein